MLKILKMQMRIVPLSILALPCMLRLKDVTMSVSVADNADVAVLLLS